MAAQATGDPAYPSAAPARSWYTADVREVAVALGDVEPVADDELGRDAEALVGQIEIDRLQPVLDEEGAPPRATAGWRAARLRRR